MEEMVELLAKGAEMKVQSFIGKVSIAGLAQMDTQINDWLKRSKVKVIHIGQSFGNDIHHDGRGNEPIIVVTIWYEEPQADKFSD